MPEDENGNGNSEGDLPDNTGETFTNLNGLKERLSGDTSDTSGGESDGSNGGSDTVRMTFHVDRETAERLRNAVYWTATPVTLSGTARDALRAAVAQLEKEYNGGKPFPDRDEELKGGNPNLKS